MFKAPTPAPADTPKPPGSFGPIPSPNLGDAASAPKSPADLLGPSPADLAAKGPDAEKGPGPASPAAFKDDKAPLTPEALAAKSAAAAAAAEAAGPKDLSEIKFKEPGPKTIGTGIEKRELRKLTPEELAIRKLKVNIVLAILGILTLGTAMFILMQVSLRGGGTRKRKVELTPPGVSVRWVAAGSRPDVSQTARLEG